MFSGGRRSLALYTLAATHSHPDIPSTEFIHLLCVDNGMQRFLDLPAQRFRIVRESLEESRPPNQPLPDSALVAVDSSWLLRKLWIDRCEQLVSEYSGRNLICVACGLAMHAKAIVYCAERMVPAVYAGACRRQEDAARHTPVFLEKIEAFSYEIGVKTRFPVYDEFESDRFVRNFLKDRGLPCFGGGERRCLFSDSVSSATDEDVRRYLDDTIPRLLAYVQWTLDGKHEKAVGAFDAR